MQGYFNIGRGRAGNWPALLLTGLWVAFIFTTTGCNKDGDVIEEQPQPEYPAEAEHWQAGQVHYGINEWTEVTVGNMPLIISVPHGGNIRPDDVPDRGCPNVTTVRDLNTIELARAIEKELIENYGVRPYVVVNYLSRTKIDQNRDIGEATCGNETMAAAWHDFHNFADTAVSTAAARHGYALFIDLHGHGHARQRLEIGYSLDGRELTQLYGGVNVEALAAKSSVQNMLLLNAGLSFRDVIIGDHAFGTLMAAEGIPSVPSRQDPFPYEGEPFFNGGYNTRYYTSSSYPNVYGWQIECHNQGVRDTAPNRENFARAFAKVIHALPQ